MRKIILHYHLFKNAGTSVDELLKMNFPGRWVTREFDGGPKAANPAKVAEWIQEEKDAIAFSSHTAMLPPPKLKGVQIFPVLFVRHPLDRIVSAYAFEQKQGGDSFGAVLARNTTLKGYIEVRLALGHDRQCRNFHVARLSQYFRGQDGDEVELALRAVQELPFVGLVEDFDDSIERMGEWLKPHFPDFRVTSVAKNVTRDRSVPLEDRLRKLREEVGDDCFTQLFKANEGDIAVYEWLADQRKHVEC
ncbi:sulfotransferase family 2 domain-containing protein [Thioalkalivibrio sulfidiphilus]|uniref:sulfotransferase family 2 domain-containing protein n=1 Tax=Thioalkalivibrio sulfidiphilus TaxID=1033854 RepID=UPI00036F99ED|nr:sulfotransferase family 2 domain-containing protein [Thioalkalivibrio sulfidiphilus]